MSDDRRSGNDRRSTNRYRVDIQIEWETSGERRPASMSDVSLDGCFILTSGDVNDGDMVTLYVPFADGNKIQFQGKIANHVFDIGFGVRFRQLTTEQRDLLINIVRNSGA